MDDIEHCMALVRARDLDRFLATLYAPAAKRPGLFALHALDLEIVEVARTTTEPMLGQIRLAWWREQLQGLDGKQRSAQPVLGALAEFALPAGVTGAGLEPLEDASLALLGDDVRAYAAARAALFEQAAILLGADAVTVERAREAGRGWAIIDLARTGRALGADDLADAERSLSAGRGPLAVRSLFGLAALARRDLASLQRGVMPRARGTPGRQIRLLWSMVTGQ